MIEKLAKNKNCPLCRGQLEIGEATIPFLFGDSVIIVKGVPAEICLDCHEPFLAGKVTDEVMNLLKQLNSLGSEVTVVNFREVTYA